MELALLFFVLGTEIGAHKWFIDLFVNILLPSASVSLDELIIKLEFLERIIIWNIVLDFIILCFLIIIILVSFIKRRKYEKYGPLLLCASLPVANASTLELLALKIEYVETVLFAYMILNVIILFLFILIVSLWYNKTARLEKLILDKSLENLKEKNNLQDLNKELKNIVILLKNNQKHLFNLQQTMYQNGKSNTLIRHENHTS